NLVWLLWLVGDSLVRTGMSHDKWARSSELPIANRDIVLKSGSRISFSYFRQLFIGPRRNSVSTSGLYSGNVFRNRVILPTKIPPSPSRLAISGKLLLKS